MTDATAPAPIDPAMPPRRAAAPAYLPPRSLAERLRGRNGSRLLTALTAAGILCVAFTVHLGAWLRAASDPQPGDPTPWVVASLLQAALVGAPLAALAWRWPHPRYRGIFISWAWAAGYGLLLAPTRLWPPTQPQLLLLTQTLLTVAYWLIVRRRVRYVPPQPDYGPGLALMMAGLLAWPWLRLGAFGSPLDVLLALAAGTAFGYLTWSVLLAGWIPAQRRDPRHPRRDRLTGGLVAGVTVLLLASALSFNGAQLLLMAALPAGAWAALATGVPGRAYSVITAALLALIDTDGVHLAIFDPLLTAYLAATFFFVLIAWLLAGLSLARTPAPGARLSYGGALALGLAAAGIAAWGFGGGQPGYHGDRLFVVLKDQADLAAVAAEPDLAARRAAVYKTLTTHAATTQAELRAGLDRLGVAYTPYYLVNALAVDAGWPVALWLRTRPEVDRVLPGPTLRPVELIRPDVGGDESLPPVPPWNLRLIGADRVHAELGIDGRGVVVGQSDSGVTAEHPALAAAYRGAPGSAGAGDDYNWFDPWYGTSAPADLSGHGTHTLGSVLGQQVGVAPGATWFACANLTRDLGNAALYLDCMQFMLAPFPQGGDPFADGDPARAADVLNNSWGCPTDIEGCDPASLAPAAAALKAAGIFVVASAGNDGPTCATVTAPLAIYGDVLSVGAVDEQGDLAAFSSAGPVTVDGSGRIKPDLLAPGVDVLSAWPTGGYRTVSGTSMAGPHVAGVVALMWSANPALKGDIDRTTAILTGTAQPFTGYLAGAVAPDESAAPVAASLVDSLVAAGPADCLDQADLSATPNIVAGYGLVDAYAAVQAALALK
jgi:subtilisin family serine protease